MLNLKSLLFLSFLLNTILSIQSHSQSLLQKMDEVIPSILEKNKVPGLAITIIDNTKIILSKGYGYADVENKILINGKTGFNIGSISKMFATWGLMKLAESGNIDLDEPVENYLSRWKIPESEFDNTKVTARNILSHTAGVSVHGYPGFPPEMELPSIEQSLNGENGPVRENEPVELLYEPNTAFKYSGGGYTILQLVIEEVTGKSFADFMDQTLFEPLGMDQTSFSITEDILDLSATPYDEELNAIYLERFTAQAAAGLHTSLSDMTSFTKQLLEGNSVLASDIYSQMTTPHPVSRGRYGLGQMIMAMGPVSVVGHAGSNDGWESAFFVHQSTNSAIIMMTNSSNGKQALMSILREWVGWKAIQENK